MGAEDRERDRFLIDRLRLGRGLRLAVQYALAPTAVAIAALVRGLCDPVLDERAISIFFIPAVILACAVGGWGPGLLAMLLGAAVIDLAFTEPLWQISVHQPADALQIGAYLLIALLTMLIVQELRRSRQAARAAEASLREREQQLELAQQAGNAGVWVFDPRAGTIALSPACCRLHGIAPCDAMALQRWLELVSEEDRPKVERALGVAASGPEGRLDVEYRRHGDGDEDRWFTSIGTAIQGRRRQRVVSGITLDTTSRRRAEEQQEMLLRELNHRIRNTLAAVQSISSQTASQSETVAAFHESFGRRIRALSQTHRLLGAAGWEGAPLEALVRQELEPYAADRIEVCGPELWLRPKAALSLHMVLHELATNAAKYGALSGGHGRLEVIWRLDASADEAQLEMSWREADGPPVSEPRRFGFGTQLIESIAAQEFHGGIRMEYPREGFCCTMRVPWDDRIAQKVESRKSKVETRRET